MKNIYKLLTLSSFLLLTACAANKGPVTYGDLDSTFGNILSSPATYIGYAGDIKDAKEVGIILTDSIVNFTARDAQDKPVTITKRSRFISLPGRTQYHLLPGEYTFSICFRIETKEYKESCVNTITKKIKIVAGSLTQFSYVRVSAREWTVVVTDGEKDRALAAKDFFIVK